MSFICIFIPSLLIFLSCCLSKSTSVLNGNMTDRFALLSIKAGLDSDPLQVTASWNESTHFCSWIGVSCRNQRVVKLDLSSSMLLGSLSPSVGNLSFLREFELYNNSFRGEIPQEIGRLSRLKILSLENNSFSGEIPKNISKCFNLIKLGLGGNNLVGTIPMEFQSLSNLKLFFVYLNNLTGQLPPYLGNISSLVSISAGGNNFFGNIPDTLGRLRNLEYVELGLNNLSGTIPSSFFNLSSLTEIDMPRNQLQGRLPPDIFSTLPRLVKLNIPRNQFTGNIPSSVLNATELNLFAININGFTGKVPSFRNMQKLDWLALNQNDLGYRKSDDLDFLSSLLNCTLLRLLHLSENNFQGVLPRFIGNISGLRRFTIGGNLIYGNIPTEIGELVNLETMYLWSNQLTGSIPDSVGKLQQLRILSLLQNRLSGEILPSIGNLTVLTELYLQGNNFQGNIPYTLGRCRSLLSADLSLNNLSGYIPEEIFSLSSLSEFLDLSSNRLVGSLSSEISGLEHLVLLNLSNNMLSDTIPDSLGSLVNLRELYMGNNFFQGNLSPMSSLKSLEILDISHNNITGKIPKFLENFSFLWNLNLSSNDLEGEVPTEGVFKNSSQVSVDGNSKLCGGIPDLQLPLCSIKEAAKKSRISRSVILIICICSSVLVLILVTISVIVYFWKHKKKALYTDSPGNVLPTVSYQSLHKATDSFSPEHLIGSGKFSSVYRGTLNENGTVAIKVLKLEVQGASRSFVAECEALRCTRHRNLVKVLTSCSSVDFQGKEFKAIVYSFMENGNLENWLHQDPEIGDIKQWSRHLTLVERLNIAIDVASALDYLHNHCGSPLVHCDLKPSNILLDGNLVAHVGDFGLARFIHEANHALSQGINGTIGYAAPEYGMGSEPSPHGDVYSYGILLLELFTGKRPTAHDFTNGLNLHNFSKMAIPERVIEICDPTLFYDEEERLSKNSDYEIKKCLISVMQIGISCSLELPRERMDISNVINELYSARNTLLTT
ncbi:putative LRR receptor-like serine/threonine-protein kinase [Forsythia ovata]|uniref:non-specific serine/threonine protein kinase n=1 Tax=Forsythia ovata TaxID=205694 RepID=A0ABD1W8Q0_9LAMI